MKSLTTVALLSTMISVAAFVAASAQATSGTRSLTVDDYFRIQRIADPQISPDGEWVAFTVSTTDLEKDKSES
jgi:hypothetical protein